MSIEKETGGFLATRRSGARCGFGRGLWIILIALIFGWISFAGRLCAESIEISGDDAGKRVLVKIENETMEAVLDELQTRYGFELEGVANLQKDDDFSEVLEGNLDDVLGRLLRNWNHMIVHSPHSKSGISKLMILNSDYGAAPPSEGESGGENRIAPVDSGEPSSQ